MAASSSPRLPSSFDPALHLRPVAIVEPILAPSNFNSDDLEALHEQNQESVALKTGQGIVVQHRAWKLNDVLRSDEIFTPDTPSRRLPATLDIFGQTQSDLTVTEASDEVMPFSSSPVAYPPSSSPPVVAQKRKHFASTNVSPKKRKIVAGFVVEGDDSDTGEEGTQPVHEKRLGAILEAPRENASPAPFTVEPELPPYESTLFSTESEGPPPLSGVDLLRASRANTRLRTCTGKCMNIKWRAPNATRTFESMVAERSTTTTGRAKVSYYGIDIHDLVEDAKKQIEVDATKPKIAGKEVPLPTVEHARPPSRDGKGGMTKMWTEKYRAKRFTDLIGDERTHRQVLRWLKGWDPVVFPGLQPVKTRRKQFGSPGQHSEERQIRKIMLLTGPPGLGKTTLAHVCAKQAGYEVLEINASDERSRDVVKGRIKDALGTENVRGINTHVDHQKIRKAGRPVCVVVDEVDGAVSGSGSSGEGGFIKALIDLVQLDQRNSGKGEDFTDTHGKRKGDKFRQLRPLILICNDVYHPSLRPLRATSIAEIVHVRKPPLDKVISRLKAVFEGEGMVCENDGVRRLCEATWGIGSRKQGQSTSRGSGEGDVRGILVAGEWAAHKLRSLSGTEVPRLTRKWVEEHILNSNMSGSGSATRGLGRGGVREIIERVFLEGAGLSNMPGASTTASTPELSGGAVLGVADIRKRAALNALREMLDTTGEHDRCISDCFSKYPTQVYQDDTSLSKPNIAYEWLHFHDSLSSRIFGSQEWELMPYLPQAILAFHNLFAAVGRNAWNGDHAVEKEEAEGDDAHPFAGPKADFTAHEVSKQNSAVITEFQSSFSPPLLRLFSSVDSIAIELLPNFTRMMVPDVKPVVVGGSAGSIASVRKEVEKNCIAHGVRVMSGLGVKFDKMRVETDGPGGGQGGWIYRMEPPLDELSTLHMGKTSGGPPAPVRYAVRQVLDQELRKAAVLQRSNARDARYAQGSSSIHVETEDFDDDKENINSKEKERLKIAALAATVKRDFFGRIVNEVRVPTGKASDISRALATGASKSDGKKVWVSFHEGYSNAVRKPLTLKELMSSFGS